VLGTLSPLIGIESNPNVPLFPSGTFQDRFGTGRQNSGRVQRHRTTSNRAPSKWSLGGLWRFTQSRQHFVTHRCSPVSLHAKAELELFVFISDQQPPKN
jgi:hypothetical protein